ncbi:hypothetical protein QE152_g33154 [Popillia japonica]|uniref:Uncharacterized protein n=1 Tax=Popillia japonica TaxID=7064 RepID=A0AAW1IXC2_POPJA
MNLNQHLLVFIVTVWLLVMNSVDAVRVGTKKKEKDHLILYNKEIIMSKYRHKHFIDLTVKLGVNHLYVIIFSVTRSDKSSNLTHFI